MPFFTVFPAVIPHSDATRQNKPPREKTKRAAASVAPARAALTNLIRLPDFLIPGNADGVHCVGHAICSWAGVMHVTFRIVLHWTADGVIPEQTASTFTAQRVVATPAQRCC